MVITPSLSRTEVRRAPHVPLDWCHVDEPGGHLESSSRPAASHRQIHNFSLCTSHREFEQGSFARLGDLPNLVI